MAKLAAKPSPAAAEPVVIVTCRVLPKGDGLVSTGTFVHGEGDLFYERGETFDVALPIAQELEERGFVEIQARKRSPREAEPVA